MSSQSEGAVIIGALVAIPFLIVIGTVRGVVRWLIA